MHPMLTIAIKAARRAGSIINRASLDLEKVSVTQKGPNDFVTNIDHEAEEAIKQILLDAYPDHAIIGEETGSTGSSDYKWLIDPLDGTKNFIHGFPGYSISLALAHKTQIILAVIYDPNANEIFTATRGSGAFLNNRRIRVNTHNIHLHQALIAAGTVLAPQEKTEFVQNIPNVIQKCSGYRRIGTTALELAYVAAGRLDGYIARRRNAWDTAAGSLLVLEAGGLVGDFLGQQGWMSSGNIVAGSPKIFAQMLLALNEE
ncbi:inositol monophosphatase family protein [Brackiella oedipodis]|uniref:inositol monophosphatase family protein n=1 Tax=Brackiella oedipodis TaxID=124225 RepID=UPI00048C22DA|nr:inositol monophosphatase family protein [Brackiella oedipodis]